MEFLEYCMPIRLPQNGELEYDPVHVRLPPDTVRVPELFPDEAAGSSHLDRIWWQEGYKRPCCGQVDDPFRIQTRAARA